MNSDAVSQASTDECYFLEVDGKPKSGSYRIFVDALIAGLQLKQQFPDSKIRVGDANEVRDAALAHGSAVS
jgi:hypothetical protein